MPVEVKHIDRDNFEVAVSSDVVKYQKVKVTNKAYYRYSLSDISEAQLVNRAFLFVLRKTTQQIHTNNLQYRRNRELLSGI